MQVLHWLWEQETGSYCWFPGARRAQCNISLSFPSMRGVPQIAETYFEVLFSCIPKDAMQSTGPRAAA